MVYYSHVNEDNCIERELAFEKKCVNLYSIGGSGERVIALLDSPTLEQAYIIDNNAEALYLIELKLTALKNLSVEEYLFFIGHTKDKKIPERIRMYNDLKGTLSKKGLNYWDTHANHIIQGILNVGNFERYLSRMRPIALWFLGSSFNKKINQTEPVDWNQKRWKFLTWLFSQGLMYRITGISDKAFLGRNSNPSIIGNSLRKTMEEDRQMESFMFQLIFKGHLNDMTPAVLPASLRPDILETIKWKLLNRQLKIHFVQNDIRNYIFAQHTVPDRSLISLSDILSFVDRYYLEDCLLQLDYIREGRLDILVRSFLKNKPLPNHVKEWRDSYLVADLSEKEKTGMYSVFHLSSGY